MVYFLLSELVLLEVPVAVFLQTTHHGHSRLTVDDDDDDGTTDESSACLQCSCHSYAAHRRDDGLCGCGGGATRRWSNAEESRQEEGPVVGAAENDHVRRTEGVFMRQAQTDSFCFHCRRCRARFRTNIIS